MIHMDTLIGSSLCDSRPKPIEPLQKTGKEKRHRPMRYRYSSKRSQILTVWRVLTCTESINVYSSTVDMISHTSALTCVICLFKSYFTNHISWCPFRHRATPIVIHLEIGFSIINTIELLGYPHDRMTMEITNCQ